MSEPKPGEILKVSQVLSIASWQPNITSYQNVTHNRLYKIFNVNLKNLTPFEIWLPHQKLNIQACSGSWCRY